MKKLILALIAALILWLLFDDEQEVSLGPGVHAPAAPRQATIQSPHSFLFGDYRITPLANFELTAKVLARQKYHFDRESDLSPMDLALGWGQMSNESILQALSISQSNRWYRWRTDTMPIPRREIETSSANMHIIPASQSIANYLEKIPPGGLVKLNGKLVRADAQDGWQWVSSLTRGDTGTGACELFYVEYVEILRQ